jgi:hypothetical protein
MINELRQAQEDGVPFDALKYVNKWAVRKHDHFLIPAGEAPGWIEERTGLHELQFIETRRHWFTSPVEHDASTGVHVLNLVEGEEAIVESPTAAFEPLSRSLR